MRASPQRFGLNLVVLPVDRRTATALLRGRWLMLAAGPLACALIELAEHGSPDVSFFREVLTYGVLFSLILWLLLTLLANHLMHRIEREANLKRYRLLNQRLKESQEWDELTRVATQFPGDCLPVDHVALFVYDQPTARAKFVDEWHAGNGDAPAEHYPTTWPVCNACLMTRAPKLRRPVVCPSMFGPPGREYCQPLAYEGLLVGLLRLRFRPGERPASDRAAFLEGVTPDIALALALALSQSRQMTQLRGKVQRDERQRIAHDLHNSLGQQIGYLHLTLDRLASDDRLTGLGNLRQEIEALRQVAEDTYTQVRGNLWLLRTQETAGFTQTVIDYIQALIEHTELHIDFVVTGTPHRLPLQLSQHVFSLVLEGVNNIRRHARAHHARITLSWAAGHLGIDLVDDGLGFDPSAAPEPGHYGLVMLRERVEALHGEFSLDSAPGHGTRLTFKIPFEQPTAGPGAER